ncbi:hypothetical protein C4B60_20385 [Jeotgalibacillus proteolyticus]|uniref:G5 domain-containing protein n=2 Tax=Jeotgalibacillus proteolyticus TaxID=2082395 RepID=A0A2S5G6F3_9BACL|nr:hypothetical protein C4B60_20385 [Jeotgalibacillus proteolyticus]
MKNEYPKTKEKKNWIYNLLTITVFVLVIGFLFQEGMKKTVALTLNGEEQLIRTNATTVEGLLAELEVDTHSKDYLQPAADTAIYHDMKVQWRPAAQVAFTSGSEQHIIMTNAQTVGDFLRKEKINVSEQDELSHDLKTKISENMTISLDKAFAFTLVDGKEKLEEWSTSITVADFLKQQNISLDKDDRVEPALETKLSQGAVVQIVRVEKVTDVVEEDKSFAVETRKDESLVSGTEEIVQEGKKGVIEKTYEVVLENGKEKSRKLQSEKVIKESVNEVVAVGTKVLVAEVSRGTQAAAAVNTTASDEPAEKPAQETAQPAVQQTAATTTAASAPEEKKEEPAGRELYVSSTAYTASCNGCSGITATGINLKANPDLKVIAVDPSVIPLGSKVYVEGYGYAVAGDTGGAIKGNKIDVFLPNKEDAYRWGNRQVKIKILP